MCFTEIVGNLVQILARNAQIVGMIEVACCYDHISCSVSLRFAASIQCMYYECAVWLLFDGMCFLIWLYLQIIMLCDLPVISQCFVTEGLLIR
ncbi:hypothetical protein D3C78_1700420 [compost metagenome]